MLSLGSVGVPSSCALTRAPSLRPHLVPAASPPESLWLKLALPCNGCASAAKGGGKLSCWDCNFVCLELSVRCLELLVGCLGGSGGCLQWSVGFLESSLR